MYFIPIPIIPLLCRSQRLITINTCLQIFIQPSHRWIDNNFRISHTTIFIYSSSRQYCHRWRLNLNLVWKQNHRWSVAVGQLANQVYQHSIPCLICSTGSSRATNQYNVNQPVHEFNCNTRTGNNITVPKSQIGILGHCANHLSSSQTFQFNNTTSTVEFGSEKVQQQNVQLTRRATRAQLQIFTRNC